MGRTSCVALVFFLALGIATACGGGGGPTPPEVLGVAPASGGVDGGAAVTVTGAHLLNDDGTPGQALFGGVAATDLVAVNAGTITCRTPAGVLGTVAVVVTTDEGAGTLAEAYVYYPVPTLTGVTPDRGPLAGGRVVTLTGTGFVVNSAGVPVVTFGGVPATGVAALTDDTITCTPPAQGTYDTYDVAVENQNGLATLADGFECVPPPTITDVDPADGPAGGGNFVTLTGTNFDAGVLSITIGGAAATNVETMDATHVRCRTPAGAEGTADVAIDTHGGMTTEADAYTYTTWSPSDPLFANQWHLENTAQNAGTEGHDAGVVPAWDLGYTGRGVTIAIVDDGMELLHEDLTDNVIPDASWDYGGDDADPTRNEHGTSVAGVSAGVGGNDIGVTGAAPNGKLVGFAVLTSGTTNADFADALSRDAATTHLYNNSWGDPAYYGGYLFGFAPSPSSFHTAIDYALTEGRGGLGCIYIKSAGNSGSPEANFDGTNSVRGVNVIGSVDATGAVSSYSQPGPCVLVCAPSNGNGQAGVTTTDRTGTAGYSSGNYTSGFGGTSSAAPLASGVVALLLEANPTLRWWEVPLVLADSARHTDVGEGWEQNGAGRWISHRCGFGVVDAEAAVAVAKAWTPRVGLVSHTATADVEETVPAGDETGITDTITVPADTGITNLHRATVTIFCDHPVASDLEIVLTSPDGTESVLINSIRTTNTLTNSLDGMPMVSWRHLDETPDGTWSLRISDLEGDYDSDWDSWTLTLEGEGTPPLEALTAPKPDARVIPPAPLIEDESVVTWYDGIRWRHARRDAAQLAEQDAVTGSAYVALRDGAAGRGRIRALTGRIVVHLDPDLTDRAIRDWEARHGFVRAHAASSGPSLYAYRVSAPGISEIAVATSLLDEPEVLHAEPDWWVERVPN